MNLKMNMRTPNNSKILLVDDDRHLLESMGAWLTDQGFQVSLASNAELARQCLNETTFDLALLDVRIGHDDGFELLAECKKHHPNVVVVLMTGYATVDTGIEAIRAGAFDLVTKPLIDDEILICFDRALSQQKVIEENEQLKTQLDKRFGRHSIIGNDHRMQKTFDMVDNIADTKATVMITGESGTGKSLIARAIHQRSSRRKAPFVEVACGALPDNLLESELFGTCSRFFYWSNWQ